MTLSRTLRATDEYAGGRRDVVEDARILIFTTLNAASEQTLARIGRRMKVSTNTKAARGLRGRGRGGARCDRNAVEKLLDATHGRSAIISDRSIDIQVSRLRRKLGDDPREPRIIKTIWGDGYLFTPDIN